MLADTVKDFAQTGDSRICGTCAPRFVLPECEVGQFSVQNVDIVFFPDDIFKEKLSKVLDVTTPAAAAASSAASEVVDIFDDPLNASDV